MQMGNNLQVENHACIAVVLGVYHCLIKIVTCEMHAHALVETHSVTKNYNTIVGSIGCYYTQYFHFITFNCGTLFN